MDNKFIGGKKGILIALGIGYVSTLLTSYVFAMSNEYQAKKFLMRAYKDLHVDFAQKGYNLCNTLTGNLGLFENDIIRTEFYSLLSMPVFDHEKKRIDTYIKSKKAQKMLKMQYDMHSVNKNNVYRIFLDYYNYFKTYEEKKDSHTIKKRVEDLVQYHEKVSDCLIKQHNTLVEILCEEAYTAIETNQKVDVDVALDIICTFMKNVEYTNNYIDFSIIERNVKRLETVKSRIVNTSNKKETNYLHNVKQLNEACKSFKNIVKRIYDDSVADYNINFRKQTLDAISKIEMYKQE